METATKELRRRRIKDLSCNRCISRYADPVPYRVPHSYHLKLGYRSLIIAVKEKRNGVFRRRKHDRSPA